MTEIKTKTQARRVATTKGGLNLCGDGCGAQANKGKRFRPGHDAKLHSMLQRVSDGEITREDLPALVQAAMVKGEVSLPEAKFTTIELRPESITVRVPAGDDAMAAFVAYVEKRNGWSVQANKVEAEVTA